MLPPGSIFYYMAFDLSAQYLPAIKFVSRACFVHSDSA